MAVSSLQRGSERQAADDRDTVQQHITPLADPDRHEPLNTFVQGPHHEDGEERQQESSRSASIAPYAVIEQRQKSVLREVKPLDGIDIRVPRSRRQRVQRAGRDRRSDEAKAQHPSLADRGQGIQDAGHDRRSDERDENESILAGERRLDGASDLPDRGRADEDDEGDTDGQRQASSGR